MNLEISALVNTPSPVMSAKDHSFFSHAASCFDPEQDVSNIFKALAVFIDAFLDMAVGDCAKAGETMGGRPSKATVRSALYSAWRFLQ
jgi:hypothetical protein